MLANICPDPVASTSSSTRRPQVCASTASTRFTAVGSIVSAPNRSASARLAALGSLTSSIPANPRTFRRYCTHRRPAGPAPQISTLPTCRPLPPLPPCMAYRAGVRTSTSDACTTHPNGSVRAATATSSAEPMSTAFTAGMARYSARSEEHTSELQSPCNLVCRLLLEKKKQPHTRKISLSFHLKSRPLPFPFLIASLPDPRHPTHQLMSTHPPPHHSDLHSAASAPPPS